MTGVTRLEQRDLIDLLRRLNLWSEYVPEALEVAERVHIDQRRDGGGPYLEEHIYPVTAAAANYLSHVDRAAGCGAVLVAILHDTIEDSSCVTEQMLVSRFGDTVAGMVATLTKPSKRGGKSDEASAEDEERYVARVAGAALPVRVIKVFDRLNNLAAVHQRPPEKRQAYLVETRDYYLDLARSVDDALGRQMEDLLIAQGGQFAEWAATQTGSS